MSNESAQFDIANVIPIGHDNAVSRKYLASVTGMSDRMVRKAIEESKEPIVNLGYGYFIPDIGNAIDVSEAQAYKAQEIARAQSILDKMNAKFSGLELAPAEA